MTIRFGAFGKMPSLGDFFRIDLPQGFVDPWDRWLQDSMPAARRALGARWQDSYFSAPIWRFTLSPGLAGAAAVTGVMMMSVDRVGRQFPLTLAAALPDGTDPALDHLLAGEMFAALETVALDALEDTTTRDVLADRLGGMTRGVMPLPDAGLRREPGGAVIRADADLVARIAADGLRAIARRPSFWSADMAGDVRMMVCEGLPAGGQLVGLFDLDAWIWTGRDPVDDGLPEPAPPAAEAPPVAATPAIVEPAAPVVTAAPLDDPLADILLPDEPALVVSGAADDDPLAAILSGSDPAFEDDVMSPLSKEA